MNFKEFIIYYLGKDYCEDYISSKCDTIRKKLEKILKVIFDVRSIKWYSSKDGLNIYWPYQEYDFPHKIEEYSESAKCVTEKISSLRARLDTEIGDDDCKKIKDRISNLEAKLTRIERHKEILENWDEYKFEDVMGIVDKDTVLSPMSNIEQNTADLYAYILNIEAFNFVETDVDPCMVLGRISSNDRKELVKRINTAYHDENFGKFLDHVIELKKRESFLPRIKSFLQLDCVDNDLFLVLYPIMCPNKYMLLRDAYYILFGERDYSDEDAYNMLNYIKEPDTNMHKDRIDIKKENQLSWIYGFITSKIDYEIEKKHSVDLKKEVLKYIEKIESRE